MKIGPSYYYVGNIQEATQIYSGLLECAPIVSEPDWIRFNLEGGKLAFHLDPKLPKSDTAEGVKFGAVVSMTVPDIQQALDKASQFGFRQVGETHTAPYGILAEIRDPWGNRFSLIEYSTEGNPT